MSRLKEKHLHQWVRNFIFGHELIQKDQHVVVGLSGGPDSMLLATIVSKMVDDGLMKSFKLVHIDHRLRSTSSRQAKKLKECCAKLGWDCVVETIDGSKVTTNIENWAREQRRNIFKKHLGKNDVLFLGHHLNDSLEWYLKQLMTNSYEESLGIPLINGHVRRPLHCLSRKQILYWVKKLEIPYLVDESNLKNTFERNAIRNLVIKPLEDIYPKGVKHFCETMNGRAKNSGKHVLNSHEVLVRKYSNDVSFIQCQKGSVDFLGADHIIAREVISLSNKKRGELRSSIKKLIAAQKKGKRGPLHFSGGVKAYCYPGLIILLNDKGLKELRHEDKLFSQQLSHTQIPEFAHPVLKVEKTKCHNLGSLKSDDLFIYTLNAVNKYNLWVRPHAHIELIKWRSTHK